MCIFSYISFHSLSMQAHESQSSKLKVKIVHRPSGVSDDRHTSDCRTKPVVESWICSAFGSYGISDTV